MQLYHPWRSLSTTKPFRSSLMISNASQSSQSCSSCLRSLSSFGCDRGTAWSSKPSLRLWRPGLNIVSSKVIIAFILTSFLSTMRTFPQLSASHDLNCLVYTWSVQSTKKLASISGSGVMDWAFWARISGKFRDLISHRHDWPEGTWGRSPQNSLRFSWSTPQPSSIFSLQTDHQHTNRQHSSHSRPWPCTLRRLAYISFI